MLEAMRWPDFSCQPYGKSSIYWNGHEGPLIDEVGRYKIIQCEPCVLTHVVPLPSEKSLKKYYAQKFFQEDKTCYAPNVDKDRKWWEMWHTDTIERIRMLSGSDIDQHTGRVLDIGAGSGVFLNVAKTSDWADPDYLYCIEPSESMWVNLLDNGYNVYPGTLKDFYEEEQREVNSFNVIHAYEVLEHIASPEDFLLQCHDLLCKDGMIAITVPNDYNALQRILVTEHGFNRYWIAPTQHLNYFTPKTLQLMLRRCGFEVLDTIGTYPMERYLLAGKNYVGDEEEGRKCHVLRMKSETITHWTSRNMNQRKWKDMIRTYRANLSEGVGREIRVFARKRA